MPVTGQGLIEPTTLYRRAEAAERLRISLRKLDELLATKELGSTLYGGRRLISERQIQHYINRVEKGGR